MALAAGGKAAHLGGALSMMEISATLYGGVMRYRPDQPEWADRDRFILSKGHGVLGYYTALADLGLIAEQDLAGFESTGSRLLGHPVINRASGIEFSTGSLGMGLSLGIGVALAGRRRGRDYRVFVLLGDGECNEGSVWEAAMAAPHFGLDRLTAIVDRNGLQQTGSNDTILRTGDMAAKWASFGWDAVEVEGHDVGQLHDVLAGPRQIGRPRAVIAQTVKGKGVSFAENNNDWHHAVLTRAQYDAAIAELEAA
jgi:transketolase